MKLMKKFALGISGLCLLVATDAQAQQQEQEPKTAQFSFDTLVLASNAFPDVECMLDGIDTDKGRVGCFTPVIAILDGEASEDDYVDDAPAE